jgi:hypothetical protein
MSITARAFRLHGRRAGIGLSPGVSSHTDNYTLIPVREYANKGHFVSSLIEKFIL